jgi:hypothetical protein
LICATAAGLSNKAGMMEAFQAWFQLGSMTVSINPKQAAGIR